MAQERHPIRRLRRDEAPWRGELRLRLMGLLSFTLGGSDGGGQRSIRSRTAVRRPCFDRGRRRGNKRTCHVGPGPPPANFSNKVHTSRDPGPEEVRECHRDLRLVVSWRRDLIIVRIHGLRPPFAKWLSGKPTSSQTWGLKPWVWSDVGPAAMARQSGARYATHRLLRPRTFASG